MTTRAISVFGLGYVGSVTAACLADLGHCVIGVDVNASKVGMMNSGRSPILESGLDALVEQSQQACRLHATTDATSAVHESDTSFICVGTPSLRNGKLDLSILERVCAQIGQALRDKNGFHLVVVRSTVFPGTTESLVVPTLEAASNKHAGSDFAVCVNPEFMREGSAVADFLHPPFTILGAVHPDYLIPLCELYQRVPGRIFKTTPTVAEMVKYMCNAFHALKVTFANEIGTLCKQLGVDAEAVTEIFTSDTKLNISAAYLRPGFAFGGSCLPKDLRALTYRAKELDLHLPLLAAILPSNDSHIERAVEAVLRTNRKRVALLGLSFKDGTDDLRESPLVQLTKRLLGEGCQMRIWDRDVSLGRLVGSNRQFIEEVIPHIGQLLCADLPQVLDRAEVVLIGTRAADQQTLRTYLRPDQTVIDLAHLEKTSRPNGPAAYEGICW